MNNLVESENGKHYQRTIMIKVSYALLRDEMMGECKPCILPLLTECLCVKVLYEGNTNQIIHYLCHKDFPRTEEGSMTPQVNVSKLILTEDDPIVTVDKILNALEIWVD